LEATAAWQLDRDAEKVELRLGWYAHCEGDQGMRIVDSVRVESPELSGQRRWSARLPNGPYSFVGELFSLVWSVELVVEPAGDAHRLDIVLAPHGKAILLYPEMNDIQS
jgi:hypothetical protein